MLLEPIMKPVHTLAASIALIVGVSCAPRHRPVALDAGPVDREALLGSWQGSYRIAGGRQGTIGFTLAAGDDQAYGDVLMIPDGAKRAYRRSPPDGPRTGALPVESEVLTIRFVRAIDGRLTGALTPYWDPDRRCLATATFRGVVDGRVMDGTFRSTCDAAGPTYTGRWAMRRTGPAPRR
jgi:hypothetical protein